MIQANELRIGSIVKCKVSNDAAFYQVVAIDGYGQRIMLSGARHGTWYEQAKLKPIVLTTEIFEQFGFGRTGTPGEYSMMDEDCYLNESTEGGWNYSVCISANVVEFFPIATLKYLHQLQNLFYDLTGLELTANSRSTQ